MTRARLHGRDHRVLYRGELSDHRIRVRHEWDQCLRRPTLSADDVNPFATQDRFFYFKRRECIIGDDDFHACPRTTYSTIDEIGLTHNLRSRRTVRNRLAENPSERDALRRHTESHYAPSEERRDL